ncbi:MAG TPA: hypothetical protein VME22_25325 [Solirubrobacteraceae bacterium]|nr:hypothetical protein [Solirubrobacteraceae bacterium]
MSFDGLDDEARQARTHLEPAEWWAIGVSVAGAVVGISNVPSLIRSAIHHHDYLVVVVVAALLVGIAITLLLRRPRRSPPLLEKTTHFHALGGLPDERVWTRRRLEQEIAEHVLQAQPCAILAVARARIEDRASLADALQGHLGSRVRIFSSVGDDFPSESEASDAVVVFENFDRLVSEGNSDSPARTKLARRLRDLATLARVMILVVADESAHGIESARDLLRPLEVQSATHPAEGSTGDIGTEWSSLIAKLPESCERPRRSPIVIVVGPSGAGKSILLRKRLKEHEDLARYRFRSESESDQWPHPDEVKGMIVVLDQFEHALIPLPWGTPRARARLIEIRDAVVELAASARAVVLGVREDWYIKLAFMRELLPPLESTTILSQIGSELDEDVIRGFQNTLRGLDEAIEYPSIPAGATPMDLQAAGQLFELDTLTAPPGGDRDEESHEVPSVTTAQRELVERYISHAPLARVALKVLHALESARQTSSTLSRPQIAAATGDPPRHIAEALIYLRRSGLVVLRAARYELRHDALMPAVEYLSAAELDPAERDNIRVAVAERHRAHTSPRSSGAFPWLVWSLIVVCVTLRAVVKDNGLWYSLSALQPPTRTAFLDPLYFAVAIPHVTWCYYIMRHQTDIYRYGDRRRLDRIQTTAGTLLLVVWIALGMFAIEWWMVAIALGGLTQAFKSLAYGYERDRPMAVARVWRTGGWRTLGNVLIVLGFGVFFALYVPHDKLSERAITGWFYLCSLPLSYAALYLYLAHLSPTVAAKFRGLLARGRPAPASAPEVNNVGG